MEPYYRMVLPAVHGWIKGTPLILHVSLLLQRLHHQHVYQLHLLNIRSLRGKPESSLEGCGKESMWRNRKGRR